MRRLAILAAAACLPAFAASAAQQKPEWPCVQRKVPELSLAQIWTGPELPPGAQQWKEDETVAGLVAELAQRRMPLDEAERRIKDFARSLPERERDERMAKLVEGLFDTMNRGGLIVVSMVDSYATILAGFLLIVPGFITDAMGLALLVPPVRRLLLSAMLPGFAQARRRSRASAPPEAARQPGQPVVIEGTYERIDDQDPPR